MISFSPVSVSALDAPDDKHGQKSHCGHTENRDPHGGPVVVLGFGSRLCAAQCAVAGVHMPVMSLRGLIEATLTCTPVGDGIQAIGLIAVNMGQSSHDLPAAFHTDLGIVLGCCRAGHVSLDLAGVTAESTLLPVAVAVHDQLVGIGVLNHTLIAADVTDFVAAAVEYVGRSRLFNIAVYTFPPVNFAVRQIVSVYMAIGRSVSADGTGISANGAKAVALLADEFPTVRAGLPVVRAVGLVGIGYLMGRPVALLTFAAGTHVDILIHLFPLRILMLIGGRQGHGPELSALGTVLIHIAYRATGGIFGNRAAGVGVVLGLLLTADGASTVMDAAGSRPAAEAVGTVFRRRQILGL